MAARSITRGRGPAQHHLSRRAGHRAPV